MAIKNSTNTQPNPPPKSHHLVDYLIKKAVPANFKSFVFKGTHKITKKINCPPLLILFLK